VEDITMTLVRWQPLQSVRSFQDEMAQLMREAFDGVEGGFNRPFVPPVDIIEKGDTVLLVADLPGFRNEDIEVSVENRTLTLAGERRPDPEHQEASTFRAERSYGRFSRVFALPATVDVAKIGAEVRDGILTVTLPKAEEARPRKIEVRVA
jgi:HSP20 family protein